MVTKGSVKEITVEMSGKRFTNGVLQDTVFSVAAEVPYTLFVNDREILSIATLPDHLEELFVGFLVSEGVLLEPGEIAECRVDHDNHVVLIEVNLPDERIERVERKGMLTSGCAGGMVFSVEHRAAAVPNRPRTMKLSSRCILDRMYELDKHHGIYRITRGVHGASLATRTETVTIREDLGRHNAVDKIVGHCFLNRIDTTDKLLVSTGRITSEVLTKASRGGFPIIISRSSVSAMAARLATQCSIDIAFYVKAGRFNYFSNGAVELLAE